MVQPYVCSATLRRGVGRGDVSVMDILTRIRGVKIGDVQRKCQVTEFEMFSVKVAATV